MINHSPSHPTAFRRHHPVTVIIGDKTKAFWTPPRSTLLQNQRKDASGGSWDWLLLLSLSPRSEEELAGHLGADQRRVMPSGKSPDLVSTPGLLMLIHRSTSATSTASSTISNAGMPTTAASPSKLAGMPAGTATRTAVPSALATASRSICSDYLCTRMLSAISWTSQYNATIFGAGVHNDRLLYKTGRDTTFDETWSILQGVFSYPPVVVSWGEGRIDVFAIGLDGAMYERHYDYPAWSPEWVSLGGFFTSPPAAVSWGAGRLDVWGIGSNAQMYHKAYDGNWDNEWYSLGGNFSSPPSAASWGPQRLDFVALDTSNTLVQNYWDTDLGGWGDWNPLAGTTMRSPPVISSRASQSLDVVGLGTNGSMMHISYDRTWGSWEALYDGPKGTWGSEPVAVVSDIDQLDIFAIASDGALWHNRLLSNVRGPWTYLGGICQSAPAAVGKNGTVSVFCINLSQSMSTRTLENSTWTDWSGLDGEFALGL